ncbi:MAG: PP2C family protein-serine/threonine phosphatase [Thermoleophilia bacterium]
MKGGEETGGTIAPVVHEGSWVGATEETEEEEELSPQARTMAAAAQSGAVLDSSLDAEVVLAHLVEYACLLFDVSSASVLLPQPDRGSYFVNAQWGLESSIKEKGISSEAFETLGFDIPVPLFIPHIALLRSIPYFEELDLQGFAGALALSLTTDTGVEGILILQDRRPLHLKRFELEALKILATHAGSALRNAEAYRLECSTADVLRQAILALPASVPGVTFACRYLAATRAAAVGGDFYDLFETADGHIGFVVGDVSGKGLSAAATTVLARDALKAYAHLDPEPSSVLERVNSLLCRSTEEWIFVTLGYFLLEPRSGRMWYSLAGHPPGLLKKSQGGVEILEQHAVPLGIFPDQRYSQQSTRLDPSDTLVLYTDGVTEARRGRYFFGEKRLSRLVQKAAHEPVDIVDDLVRRLRTYTRGDYRDDAVIMAIQFLPGQS